MYEPGGDGAGVVPMNARPANGAATSPSRRSPSVAVLSSSSPVGFTSAPTAPCLHSGRGAPLSPPDGIAATDGVVGASAAAAVTAGASMYTRDRTVPAAMLGDEELDMFDIELQRDFQSKVVPCAMPPALGAHTTTATSSPPMAGLAGGSSNGRISTSAATTGMRLNNLYSPWNANVAFENGSANGSNSKQFASLADMCQTANFLERRDDAQRLVHRMAAAIRKEMHVALDHGVLVTVTGTGGGGSTTANTNNNNNASPTAAPGEARSQADTPVLAPLSGASPRSFETDIQLVNFVISEVNRRYGNAVPSPSSPRALGAAAAAATAAAAGLGQAAVPATVSSTAPPSAPTMAMSSMGASTKASAASKNYASRAAAAAAAAPSPTGLVRGPSQSAQPHLHRSSALSAQALYAQQMQARREYTSGRSTIDTEVNDSLGRIYTSSERSVLPHHSHFQPSAPVAIASPQLHELVQRPGNPCPAGTNVAAGWTSHTHARTSATATAHPGTYPAELLRVALLHNKDTAAMSARFGGSATSKSAAAGPPRAMSSADYEAHMTHHGWDTRSNQSTTTTARSESGVQCPRAVKPPTTTSSVFTKTSGPRNRTGKNIVPSDRSAFSECSGGETRSSFHSQMNSTFRHNHSSSTCRTTDTSLSGAIPVVVSKAGPGANSGAGGRPTVLAAAGPGNVQNAKEELHAAS